MAEKSPEKKENTSPEKRAKETSQGLSGFVFKNVFAPNLGVEALLAGMPVLGVLGLGIWLYDKEFPPHMLADFFKNAFNF